MRPQARWLSMLLAAVLIALVARTASAHQTGLSRGSYALHGSVVDAELTFAVKELALLAPALDGNKDGELDDAELAAGRAAIEAKVFEKLLIRGDELRCRPSFQSAVRVEGDGVTVRAGFDCERRPKRVAVAVGFFDGLAHGHRHLVELSGGGTSKDALLRADEPAVAIDVGAASDAWAPKGSHDTSAFALFKLGIEHILTGYDHLVFLFGLVLIGGRWRSLAIVVTAFTVAHSITLGLAATGVFAPSARFVEPAIALSIAYVGVENFFVKSADKRWRITFPFGLIHGFGFAGALHEIALPQAKVPMALVMFNLGVEAGQLAVLALLLPLVALIHKRESVRRRVVPGLSALIVVAGVAWFVTRVMEG